MVKSKAQLGEELEVAFAPGLAARDPERYLDYALELPGRIAEADRTSVVVFFDEFQEVASPQQPYGDADRLTKRMRSIFQRSSGVSYLFAGSIEHLTRDLFTLSHRALHQFGGFHDLGPIDEPTRGDWIDGAIRADGCEVDPRRYIGSWHGELQPRPRR